MLRIRRDCAVCGLLYDQWAGEWITPTYIASTLGMLVAFLLIGVMIATGTGLDAPVSPELWIGFVSGMVALVSLRPAKAGWLAFLYLIGGVEVSAETRALLRWSALASGQEDAQQLVEQAEGRARRARPPRDRDPGPTLRRFVSVRGMLFPDRAPLASGARAPGREGLEMQRQEHVDREPEHEEPAR
jgi:uncharacterized protein (DUF983 family)